jgi:hypothetical protein
MAAHLAGAGVNPQSSSSLEDFAHAIEKEGTRKAVKG